MRAVSGERSKPIVIAWAQPDVTIGNVELIGSPRLAPALDLIDEVAAPPSDFQVDPLELAYARVVGGQVDDHRPMTG